MNISIKRLIAFWIDYIIAFFASFILHSIVFGKYPTFFSAFLLVVSILVLLFLKDIICIKRSIGKRLLKLKIVSDKKKVSFFQVVLRNITLVIIPVETVLILTNNKRLGDILAKTQVVEHN